jgi:uncharacterized surface protein with fasciclin (FAS1) repeats
MANEPDGHRLGKDQDMRFERITASIALAAVLFGIPIVTAPCSAGAGSTKDLVDTAIETGSFTTLVTAVKAAGLAETLKGEGPFTVFAPTDAAFAMLPPGTLEELLRPENKAKLQGILGYHVVPGKVMAADVTKLTSAKTVNGQSLAIATHNGAVMVDNAKVIKTDVAATNGVIHVIDTAVLPK